MKKYVGLILLVVVMTVWPGSNANAQIPILEIIKAAVVKAIKAADLQIQRLQNKTIWLQNAQKTLENTLSKLKLDEISGWVDKQRTLYADYFDELHRVRSIIAYYHRIKSITEKQVRIVDEYKRSYALFKQDDHFSTDEIEYMGKVYTGIFDESLQNLDQLFLVINAFATTMTDAKRLEIIDQVAGNINGNYTDLQQFNQQNKLLSLQRAKNEQEIRTTKALYGLE